MRTDEYEARQAELEEMHADYEATDQDEYEKYIDELDARDANRS
ncbi:hypothetical protein OG217_37240 (plasmid) [Streptomyces sp. NBC_01023]|nr:hypothetical protein OG217_37240 [Streptomyces sp. NBC_01023]